MVAQEDAARSAFKEAVNTFVSSYLADLKLKSLVVGGMYRRVDSQVTRPVRELISVTK